MIRPIRKQHRWTFLILGVVLLIILLWALTSRPDWRQTTSTQDTKTMNADGLVLLIEPAPASTRAGGRT